MPWHHASHDVYLCLSIIPIHVSLSIGAGVLHHRRIGLTYRWHKSGILSRNCFDGFASSAQRADNCGTVRVCKWRQSQPGQCGPTIGQFFVVSLALADDLDPHTPVDCLPSVAPALMQFAVVCEVLVRPRGLEFCGQRGCVCQKKC